GWRTLRRRALRRRSLPPVARPGRPEDRRRPALAKNGPGDSPALRPTARAEVGYLNGRLRHFRRRVQQLRHRAGLQSGYSRRCLRSRLPAAPRSASVRHPPAPEENRRREGLLQARLESCLIRAVVSANLIYMDKASRAPLVVDASF